MGTRLGLGLGEGVAGWGLERGVGVGVHASGLGGRNQQSYFKIWIVFIYFLQIFSFTL